MSTHTIPQDSEPAPEEPAIESETVPVTTSFGVEPEVGSLTPIETQAALNHLPNSIPSDTAVSATETKTVVSKTTRDEFEVVSLSGTKYGVLTKADSNPFDIKTPSKDNSLEDLIEKILSEDNVKVQDRQTPAPALAEDTPDSSFNSTHLEDVPLLPESKASLKEAKIVQQKSKESCNITMAEETNPFTINDGDALIYKSKEALNTCPRDPNGLNSDCVVSFEEVIGENDVPGRVPNGMWSCNQKTFAFCQHWTYFVLSVIAAGPAAVYWGMYYAIVACANTWCFTPWLRAMKIHLNIYRKLWGAVVHMVCDPCVEVFNACTCCVRRQ